MCSLQGRWGIHYVLLNTSNVLVLLYCRGGVFSQQILYIGFCVGNHNIQLTQSLYLSTCNFLRLLKVVDMSVSLHLCEISPFSYMSNKDGSVPLRGGSLPALCL